MQPVRWGILSTAAIGLKKVIPAMQATPECEIVGIASRDFAKADSAAGRLGIPKAYGSYEALLADPDIEAVYVPPPNHRHVPLSIAAAEHGKHVLCEKPIALTAAECATLIDARDRTGTIIVEAFMVRYHPQWLRAREIVRSGEIGDLLSVQTLFSFFNDDGANIRNKVETGGGALYDIGVYPIVISRFLFESEPTRVVASIDRDPQFGVDRRIGAMMEFETGSAGFLCSTQMVPYQRTQILGTKGRIEIQIPFNAPPDRPTRLLVDDGSQLGGGSAREEVFPVCDQYGLQGAAVSRLIRGEDSDSDVRPLEDALANMKVVDALFRSATNGGWAEV